MGEPLSPSHAREVLRRRHHALLDHGLPWEAEELALLRHEIALPESLGSGRAAR
jgi:hypothetical protein